MQSLSRVVCGGRGQRNKVMKYGEGPPGESVVHGPRTFLLRHCLPNKIKSKVHTLFCEKNSLMWQIDPLVLHIVRVGKLLRKGGI